MTLAKRFFDNLLVDHKELPKVVESHAVARKVSTELPALWAGVDLRTVQDRMGHKDIASTMRYLKPQRGARAQQMVEAICGSA